MCARPSKDGIRILDDRNVGHRIEGLAFVEFLNRREGGQRNT